MAFERAERADVRRRAPAAADVRHRRRRPDRRRAGRRARRDRAAGAAARVPRHRFADRDGAAPRRRPARAAGVSAGRCAIARAAISSGSASPCAPAPRSIASMRGVVHIGDERIEAGTILWAAGVQASPLGAHARRAARSRRARAGRARPVGARRAVDLRRRRSGDARRPHGASRCPASPRSRSRRRSTRSRAIEADRRRPPRGAFRYRNPGDLATIGRAAAVADLGWIRFAGLPAWLFWLFVHILKLTGFRNRLVVLVQWAWAYVTFQRSVRLITGARRRRPRRRRWRDAPHPRRSDWR